jgi:glycosyltransferase involved in cell wall biosynthesis
MVLDPPGTLHKYWFRGAGALIAETVRAFRPQIVECHSLHTAIYRRFCEGVPAVLREHNVEYKVWERYAANASGWVAGNYARWTAPRVRRYEAEAASRFERCIVVSPADAEFLRAASPTARVEVVPFGVDMEYFYPLPDVPEEPCSVTITGDFGWGPKQQSLNALLTQVFPVLRAQYPPAKLYVVGKGVPSGLRNLAEGLRGVVVTGPVADVRPYIARSSLLINYVVAGGGIALKVLEAMAMRKPVLCNLLGCEGTPLVHGRDVFVADGPEDFASAAAYLLRDEGARRGLAEQGHQRVLETYSWNVVASRLQECYQSVVEELRHCFTGLAGMRG